MFLDPEIYYQIPKLDIYARVDYFGIDFGDYSGSLSDFGIGIEYQVFENFGLGVGWNATNADLEIDDDGELYLINQNISGVLAYVSYSF